MSIYKSCGISGEAASEVTPELYRRWGYALGRRVGPAAKFVVGGDLRESTPARLAALSEGLCLAGVDCIDIGLLPTPMIFHAKRRLRAEGCAAVTASHQPAPVNGLTWMIGDLPPGPPQVAELEQAAAQPSRASCNGSVSSPRQLDVSFDYVAWLQETWCDSLRASLHVVLDPMHGSWSGRARRYFHAIFPECLISTIRDSVDPLFGGRIPDCARQEHLDELCETVYRERADLGVAFDGDGDRLAVVDDRGIPLTPEETAWVLLESYGRDLKGKKFVYDQRFSDRLAEAARERGAEPLLERGDPAFIRARMRQTGAAFGAQVTGHYFFAELDGGDDGLFAACRLIAYLSRSKRSLAKLRKRCPKVFMTPPIHLPLDPQQQDAVLEQLAAAWKHCPQTRLDGLRIEISGGWALIRRSTSDTALTFRFEASDWPGLDDLVRGLAASLPELGEQLWNRYETLMCVEGRVEG
jgi:phosphomannomutase / phosphoglucomutase